MTRARAKALAPVSRPRHCDDCGARYLRRNQVEAWVTQNPGHRAGWQKQIRRVCTRCGPAAAARRMLFLMSRVS